MQEENDMLRVMRRLEALENSQKASVESALEELQHFIKMPMFNKEKALDYLINLKIVAKESNHPKSGFFNAVLQAMKDKIRVRTLNSSNTFRSYWATKIMKRFSIRLLKLTRLCEWQLLDPSRLGVVGVVAEPRLDASLVTKLVTIRVIALIGRPGIRQRKVGFLVDCRSIRNCETRLEHTRMVE